MSRGVHSEQHFTSGNFVRDVVIGMADGLTVPFALAAGLSGAVSSNRLIIIGGLAEIAAGSIAMGLGGYMAARGDAEHYEQERDREEREVIEIPEEEKAEISRIFQSYAVTEQEAAHVVEGLARNPKAWVDFVTPSSWISPTALVENAMTRGPGSVTLTDVVDRTFTVCASCRAQSRPR